VAVAVAPAVPAGPPPPAAAVRRRAGPPPPPDARAHRARTARHHLLSATPHRRPVPDRCLRAPPRRPAPGQPRRKRPHVRLSLEGSR
jgi:hypothetical protein